MAFSYEFELRDKYVLVRTRGAQTSLEQGVAYARDIANSCTEHRVRRALLDERELQQQTSTTVDFELVMCVLRERWHMIVQRVACVPRPEDISKLKFFEDVAQNRGLNFRLFETLDAATRWVEES